MGVKVRERPEGYGVWWIMIDHQTKRKAKKIGKNKDLADQVAEKMEAKIVLGTFNLDDLEAPDVQTFEEYAEIFHTCYKT